MKARCSALDSQGRRCSETRTQLCTYHGDGELYRGYEDDSPGWIVAPFCRRHRAHLDRFATLQRELKARRKQWPSK